MDDITLTKLKIINLNGFSSKTYELYKNNTIEEFKLKIKDKEGYSLESINLFLFEKILENDKTLEYYNIENNSILTMEVNGERTIIYAKPILGKKLSLDTKISEKIENIKIAIQKHEIIPKELQVLKYNGQILENNNAIKDYNIPNFSTIELSLNNKKYEIISIYIIIQNEKHCINVINHLNLIKSIKIKMEKITKVPTEEQILYYHEALLSDNFPIDYYKIKPNSFLNLVFTSINLKVGRKFGNKKSYLVKIKDTIKELKQRIEEIEDLNISNQKLKYGEIELEDDKTIEYYKIQNGSSAHLFYKSEGGKYIFIKEGNQLISLDVNVNDKIKNIKDMLVEKTSKIFRYLNYGGKVLKDQNSLKNYNIQSNSTIFAF